MPTSSPDLAEQLAQAHAKISELQTALDLSKRVPAQAPSVILESITDGFVAVDAHLRYTWVNAEAERLMGIPRQDLLGRSMLEAFTVSGTELEKKCLQALAERTTQAFQYFHAPWNRWFYNQAYPTADGGLAIYWRDITEHKRLQSDLRRQASILEQVHCSIITTDLEGHITIWNRAATEMFGYESEEVLGRHVSLLYFEDDRGRLDTAVLQALRRDGHCDFEMRNRRKSGDECHIRISLSLLRDEREEPYAMLGVSTDITELRRAGHALRESEERYRGLTDAMPQIAYITTADGKTELINDHWQRYAGIPVGECLDLKWIEWVHPDDVPQLLAQWEVCLTNGECFEIAYRLRNRSGEYRWHLGRAVPVRGADGQIIQWAGTATEIHAQKTAEDALARANVDLQQFAYSASHDLQEPLRAIGNYSQLLSNHSGTLLDKKASVYLGFVIAGAAQMRTLLEDLLTYCEIGGVRSGATSVALNSVFEKALVNLTAAIEENQAVITRDELPTVVGYEAQLVQLFQNLISNAIKYRREQAPRVHVGTARTADGWVFTVADNGVGIAPQYHQEIFGVFKRLHGKRIPGTGIGLAICKRVVEACAGRIWVESEVNQGSRFCFTLPAEPTGNG